MGYVMDAVFIDGGGRVTKVVREMKPWRIVPLARGSKDCIELLGGAATATRTQVGDELRLVDIEG
jgi:uncharacterized membrane protein (UPF0127 family)